MRVFPTSTPFQRHPVIPPFGVFHGNNADLWEEDWVELTDQTPYFFQSETNYFELPGMTWTPPASGTYLVISSLEVSWGAGTFEYFRNEIAVGGSPAAATRQVMRSESSLDDQTWTLLTVGVFTTASAISQMVSANTVGTQVWKVGRRALTIIAVDPSKILWRNTGSVVTTPTSDFSVTLDSMEATEGSTLMFDGTTPMPPGTYLLLFSTFAYKTTTGVAGSASEYRVYQDGTEVADHLRRRLDWEADIDDTAANQIPIFIPAIVNVGTGETTSIRWAEPTATTTITNSTRNLIMLRVSPIDCQMVGGTAEDADTTADTWAAIDDLSFPHLGRSSRWLGLWSANIHADETTPPGQEMTFALKMQGVIPTSPEDFANQRTQTYPDVFGLTDSFANAMGHGRMNPLKDPLRLVWQSNLATSRSVLNRTLVVWRPDTSDWPARYVPNNPLLKM